MAKKKTEEDPSTAAVKNVEETSSNGANSTYKAATTPEGVPYVIQERGKP